VLKLTGDKVERSDMHLKSHVTEVMADNAGTKYCSLFSNTSMGDMEHCTPFPNLIFLNKKSPDDIISKSNICYLVF